MAQTSNLTYQNLIKNHSLATFSLKKILPTYYVIHQDKMTKNNAGMYRQKLEKLKIVITTVKALKH